MPHLNYNIAVAAEVLIILALTLWIFLTDEHDTLLGVCDKSAFISKLHWTLATVVDITAEFSLVLLTSSPLTVFPFSEPGAVTHTLACGLVQV